ncbi:DL-endopeptidase inhibitor IseA family protein [Peribacillus frigoritolerans]|nr:DL-endopeptidase inhibitor IseA family protein [Peribacillus frigoritolerans]
MPANIFGMLYMGTNPVHVHKKTFNYKGTEYSYLCQEFNTKDKLTTYLAETFTNNAVEKGLTEI